MPKTNNNFDITIPQLGQEINTITNLQESIKNQRKEIYTYRNTKIDDNNFSAIEKVIFATEDLINNCIEEKKFRTNRDETFIDLIFYYHNLSLKLRTYKVENKLDKLEKQNLDLQKKQKNIENENGKLVYNILGFIASFSVISAAVTAINSMKSFSSILLFMAFVILLLITTLIALDNFYRNSKENKNILQNNYFLWIILVVILFGLCCYKGFEYIKINKEDIFEAIGRGIATVQMKNE